MFGNILCTFYFSSKSHKCQKHAEQELMKMADKHRYCKNLPNIFGRFRVTLDHVWPLRYITLSHPCVIYLYCFCIVWSYKHTHTAHTNAQYDILHTAILFFSSSRGNNSVIQCGQQHVKLKIPLLSERISNCFVKVSMCNMGTNVQHVGPIVMLDTIYSETYVTYYKCRGPLGPDF